MVPWGESGPDAGAETLLATAQEMQALTPAARTGVQTQSVAFVVPFTMAGSFVQAHSSQIVSSIPF